jgi:hypothetical protein
MRKFTKQQVDFICANLDFWYTQAWQNDLSGNSSKEKLRKIVCKDYSSLEDEYATNLNIYKKPWETEPDFLEFVDESTGYRCFIQRHPELKHLCGYVELPEKHKLYGETNVDNKSLLNLDVHGGVTYANAKRIKSHEKRPNLFIDEYTSFVVGFDCGHAGDLVPGVKNFHEEVYRDIGLSAT